MTLNPEEYRKKAQKIFNSSDVNFEDYLLNEEHELLAIRFFDVSNLENTNDLSEREKILIQIQNEVLEDPLEISLQKYSSGIVLGALINAVRRFESSIQHQKQYSQATEKIERWNSMHISPDLKPYLRDVILRIWDIRDWQQAKATKYFPLVEKIIQEFYQCEEKPKVETILESLLKEETDREIFFLISGLLKTNPNLHEMLKIRCNGLLEDPEPLLRFFLDILSRLAEKSMDKEVRGLAQLFLVMTQRESGCQK